MSKRKNSLPIKARLHNYVENFKSLTTGKKILVGIEALVGATALYFGVHELADTFTLYHNYLMSNELQLLVEYSRNLQEYAASNYMVTTMCLPSPDPITEMGTDLAAKLHEFYNALGNYSPGQYLHQLIDNWSKVEKPRLDQFCNLFMVQQNDEAVRNVENFVRTYNNTIQPVLQQWGNEISSWKGEMMQNIKEKLTYGTVYLGAGLFSLDKMFKQLNKGSRTNPSTA